MHLVGITIEIYHDARSHVPQIKDLILKANNCITLHTKTAYCPEI